MRVIALLTASLILLSTEPLAAPVWSGDMDGDRFAWFYNKPAISDEQLIADLAECRIVANVALRMHTVPSDYTPPTPSDNLVTDLLVEPVGRALFRPGQVNALVDNCMVDRRYRRFDIRPGNQRTFLARLATLPAEARHAYFSAEQPPEGVLARVWESAVSPRNQVTAAVAELGPLPTAPLPPRQDNLRAQITNAGAIDPGKALIVLSFHPNAEGRRLRTFGLGFVRFDRATGNVATSTSNAAFYLVADYYRSQDRREPNAYRVYQVDPGMYAFSNWGRFCLGTVWFEARAGDVIHAGDWIAHDVTNNRQYGILGFDRDAARAALSRLDPARAAQLAPATYNNGARLPCFGVGPIDSFALPETSTP